MAEWVAVGAVAVSSLIGAAAAHNQGEAQNQIAQYNANAADQNARQTMASANAQEGIQRIQAAQILATNRAALGAMGVTPEGSPLLSFEDTAMKAELDAQNIRYQGKIGYLQDENQASVYRAGGQAAVQAGNAQAVSTLIGGAGRGFGMVYGTPANPARPSGAGTSLLGYPE